MLIAFKGIADLVGHPGGQLPKRGEALRLLELPLHLDDSGEMPVLVVVQKPHRQEGNQNDKSQKDEHIPPVFVDDPVGVPPFQPEPDDPGDPATQAAAGRRSREGSFRHKPSFGFANFGSPSETCL